MGQHSYFGYVLDVLISIVFNFFIWSVWLRFMLQWVRADFYNPYVQTLVTITNPLLLPLRRLVPGLGGIDLASVLLALALAALEWTLRLAVGGMSINPVAITLLAITELLSVTIYAEIFSILILVVVSWINPQSYNPLLPLLVRLTDPIVRPIRRLIPAIGLLDLSPMAATLALFFGNMLIVIPIQAAALRMASGVPL